MEKSLTPTAFRLIDRQELPEGGGALEFYQEPRSGSRHVHLSTDDDELAFLVAFETRPTVGDGRAHVLEHLVLSGSQRYPVDDPFFAMTRRSVAIFMNAMTYADRTVYPFATVDARDFYNLLDVYLDATFHPRLEHRKFEREGWRYVLGAQGRLGLQGVVCNEMKGLYADPVHLISRGLQQALFDGTTYAIDSGGDPLLIPSLDWATLRGFHARYYHPASALFMTAGRVDPREVQARLVDQLLTAAPPPHAQRDTPVQPQAWDAPRDIRIPVPASSSRAHEHGVQLAWRLDSLADTRARLRTAWLSQVLLGDAGAPLQQALQSAGYGRSSVINGLDTRASHLVMHAGLSGLRAEQVAPARELILDALAHAVRNGVPMAAREAALRDLRVAQRGWPAGPMPTGLGRLIQAVPLLLHGVPLRNAFAPEEEMAQLAALVAAPDFFADVLGDMLNRSACVCAHVEPDPDFLRKREQAEASMLNETLQAMDDRQKQALCNNVAGLRKRAATAEERNTLPCTRPTDLGLVPRQLPSLLAAPVDVECAGAATNGMTQVRVTFDMTPLLQEHPAWLQSYADVVPELGVRGLSSADAASWRRTRVSGFGMVLDSITDAAGDLTVSLSFQASAPREDQDLIAPVLQAWINDPSLADTERLRYVIQTMVDRRLNGLPAAGHALAELAACAMLSAKSAFDDRRLGVGSTGFLADLRSTAASESGLDNISRRLDELRKRLTATRPRVLCIGLTEDVRTLEPQLKALVEAVTGVPVAERPVAKDHAAREPVPAPVALALHLPGLVQHCVQAWPAPLPGHRDAPILAVAAELLVQQWLHPALRERGGAYGAMAAYRGEQCAFVVSSFRDPRLVASYEDFDAAVWALAHEALPQTDIDEAIVSVIRQLDKPLAPADEALLAWRNRTRGIDIAHRAMYRARVLACSAPRLREVALRWLTAGTPHRAAAVGHIGQDLAGLVLWNPPDLADSGTVRHRATAAGALRVHAA
jgi:Zn-dependent M16 (insulinase) family peptidase